MREPSTKNMAGVPVTPNFLAKDVLRSSGVPQSPGPVGVWFSSIHAFHALFRSAAHQICFDLVAESADSKGTKNV